MEYTGFSFSMKIVNTFIIRLNENADGGAEGKVFELTLDPLELARKFAELKFALDCVKMILNSQSEKKDGLVL